MEPIYRVIKYNTPFLPIRLREFVFEKMAFGICDKIPIIMYDRYQNMNEFQ